jgi:hypothetical protein
MSERQINEITTVPEREMHGWRMANRQAFFLDKIVELCKEEEINLILVTAPVSNLQFYKLRNYDDFHKTIAAYAALHGLPYLDFNKINAERNLFGDEHFMDARHLNYQGVKIANDYFMEWFLATGNWIFPY